MMNRSTTSTTSNKESSTDPSPPPLQTAEQLQASGPKKTETGTLSLHQDESRKRSSACPMARWKRQATWTNSIMTCATLQRMYTSCQELNATLSSASPSSSMQTILLSSKRTKSTSTMQSKQPSSSVVARFSKDGDADKQIYGESPSLQMSRTTTPTQSSAIDALQNSYPTDHHQARPPTTCTSSKRNPNSCDTTTRQPDCPLNHHG
jgi:hypothetical protein